jgi:hypothetical protein
MDYVYYLVLGGSEQEDDNEFGDLETWFSEEYRKRFETEIEAREYEESLRLPLWEKWGESFRTFITKITEEELLK